MSWLPLFEYYWLLLRLVLARRPRDELEGSDVSARCGGRKRVPVKEELVCRTLGITMGVAKEIKKDDSVAPTNQAPNPGAPLDRSLPCATAPEIRSLPKSSPCSSTSWTPAGRWEQSGERDHWSSKGSSPRYPHKTTNYLQTFSAKVRKDPIKPRDGARKQNTSYMNLLREKPRIWERKGKKGKQSTAMEKPTKTKLQNDLERERRSYKRNRNRAITEQLDQPAKATTTSCNATTPPARS